MIYSQTTCLQNHVTENCLRNLTVFKLNQLFLSVFQIHSDFDDGKNILYSLEGIGANQYPFHVFVVDPESGAIRLTQKLDREYISLYNVSDTWQILLL